MSNNPAPACDLGVGCNEVGICFAAAHGQLGQCGRPDPDAGSCGAMATVADIDAMQTAAYAEGRKDEADDVGKRLQIALDALESIASMYDHETSVGELASRLYEARCIANVAIAALAKETGAA